MTKPHSWADSAITFLQLFSLRLKPEHISLALPRMFTSWTAQLSMDKQPTVVFRNVGQLYFPQTRVECHYSLAPDHQWSSSDWIGIFEVTLSKEKERSRMSILSRWKCTFCFCGLKMCLCPRWAVLQWNSIIHTHGHLFLKATLRAPVSTTVQFSRVRIQSEILKKKRQPKI